ncbi:DUF4277 domain-containing protein [Streptomyces sp. NPDC060085]|uniref:DUF4277 domain-containing protein n=1 Tax=Streptomyces sp. NPDC060085 TaxID=3347054 RepID=UPI00365401B5
MKPYLHLGRSAGLGVPVRVSPASQRVRRRRAELAIAPVMKKRLGALPVCAGFLRRLNVAEIMDGLCPVREMAYLTLGQVIETLIANRPSSPTRLLKIGGWAKTWVLEEASGIVSAVP